MKKLFLSLLLIAILIISGCVAGTATTTQTTSPTTSTTVETPSGTANIRITYIFYDGKVYRSEADEYVEIINSGTIAVNLEGWRLVDISEGYPSFTFPDYNLQPGKIVRVYTNQIHYEYGGFSFGYGKAIWNNTSPDTAALYNTQGNEVSRKSY